MNFRRHSVTVALLASLCVTPHTWAQAVKPTSETPAKDSKASTESKPATSASPSEGTSDEILLSPFVVDVSKDKGYYAENTLAGSRLSSNLADLAASITVVTKQQMEDTASLDINDVFRYEANTEGSSSYTPLLLDRGSAKDTVAGYSLGNDGSVSTNATANRIRGLGSADASINYYPTNPRVPFDAYNTQSVEISRGPNSLLFGVGSPAGIVNQSTAQAVLTKDINTVGLRTDQYGSFRSTLGINRVLLKDKLAVYLSFLYNNQQFERKPSYDLTRRQYGAITYKPFKKTTIRAFAENFVNNANRPNFLTPRDFVTPWLASGRPAYDPITHMITKLDTNQTYGPYVGSTAAPGYIAGTPTGDTALSSSTSPFYVTGIQLNSSEYIRPLMRIDDGNLIDWFQRQPSAVVPAFTNPAIASSPTTSVLNSSGIFDRKWTISNGLPVPAGYSSYQYSGVTNSSIYDWTKYNTNQSNFGWLRSGNYNVELEQEILPNLFLNAGWFRQDIDSVENYTLSQTTGATLFVDTNTKLPNGQANPYFGLPFLEDTAPDTFYNPERDDNYRVMLAYDLDLTQRGSWLKWLGHHRMLGLWSEQDQNKETIRRRLEYTNGDADATLRYLPNTAIGGWNYTGGTLYRYYYLASPGAPDATVTHSAGFWGNQGYSSTYNGSINVYNWNTGQFQQDQVGITSVLFPGGSFKSQREVKSKELALQSYLFEDRLITTLGWHHDDYRARITTTGQITDASGTVVAPALVTATDIYDPTTGLAKENLIMNRWNHWDKLSGDTKTLGFAFRPLKGWRFTETPAARGNGFADFLRGLTFYFNKSDNFNPPGQFQTDVSFRPLPKPSGKTEEIGVGASLFNNKLVARLNWFDTTNENERTTAASTLISRLVSIDTSEMQNWASAVVRIRSGEDPTSSTFGNVPLSVSQLDSVYKLMGLPTNYYSGLSAGATQNNEAKGLELQITYNPLPNWTMKVTAAKQQTVYTTVAPEYDAWLAKRMPVWLAATAPDMPAQYSTSGGTPVGLQSFWNAYGYDSNTRLSNTNGDVSTVTLFNNSVASQVALAKALAGLVAPNQRLYHATFLSNYVFPSGMLKGFSVGGSERWESKSALGFLGKAADPTQPTLINASDPNKPVYDKGNYYTDVWIAYTRKVFSDRSTMKIQLNCNNATESGRLQPIAVNWDGSPYAYRIIDPRQFVLTATFTF